MKRNWRRTLLAGSAAAALVVVSGCSMLPGGFGGPADEEIDDGADSAAAPAADPAAGADDEEAEDAGDGLAALPVAPQEVGVTVHARGMEYTIDSLDVIDLDAESGQQTRAHGAEVILSGSVVNPGGDSQVPNAPFTLQWQDPGTGHSFETRGRTDVDAVPSGGSGPLEVTLPLNPQQLETFDQDSAMLFVGQAEYSPAQAPLGSAGELITRIPVSQPGLVEETFSVAGQLDVTILQADLRWDVGQGAEDGTAVLELQVEVRNNTERQQCWSRGAGNNFALLASDGSDSVDLEMSDRGCVAGGGSTISWTGLPVHEDYAGEYTLVLDYGLITPDDQQVDHEVPIEFTMVEEPAVLLSER